MKRRTDPETSLLVILMAIAAFVIFLPLDSVALFDDERLLLDAARKYSSAGLFQLFAAPVADFSTEAYAYIVSVNLNVFHLSQELAVRLPGALIIWLLTVSIFRFRGHSEPTKYAFLAALIFLSAYSVSAMAYHANPLTLTSIFLIASLASLYHWVKLPTKAKAYLLTASAALSILFFGILAPISIGITGMVFLLLQEKKRLSQFLKLAAILLAAGLIAFVAAAFIYNNIDMAGRILGIGQLLEPIEEYSRLEILALQLLFSIFPWSIPIIVALGWVACNPRWVKNKFLALSLFRQFGVIVFILALPFITALNGLSLIMLLAAIYFNVPTISRFLLSQTHNHTITWRITGGIFALLIALFALTYVALLSGADIVLFGHTVQTDGHSNAGGIFLLAAIAASIYSLWRNQRTIRFNNRYLYNIVILYIWAQILYKAYINPYLTAI